jgi:hypothetical protein
VPLRGAVVACGHDETSVATEGNRGPGPCSRNRAYRHSQTEDDKPEAPTAFPMIPHGSRCLLTPVLMLQDAEEGPMLPTRKIGRAGAVQAIRGARVDINRRAPKTAPRWHPCRHEIHSADPWPNFVA